MYGLLKLTGEQIRAARALVRVDQSELARMSGLSLETIKRLERIRGQVEASSRTLIALGDAFARLGIEFDESFGVRVSDAGAGDAPRVAAPARAEAAPPETLHRIIYYSTATDAGASAQAMQDIQTVAVTRNAAVGVTGALMRCDGRFLQMLEGGKSAVLQVYGSISADPRHFDLRVIESRATARRQFADWSLCCAAITERREVFGDEPAFRDAFRPELLTPSSASGLLMIVRDLQMIEAAATPRRSISAGA